MHVLIHEHHFFKIIFSLSLASLSGVICFKTPKASSRAAPPQHLLSMAKKASSRGKKEDPKNKVRWLEIMNKEHEALLEKTRQAVQKEMRRKEFKDWVKKKEKEKRHGTGFRIILK